MRAGGLFHVRRLGCLLATVSALGLAQAAAVPPAMAQESAAPAARSFDFDIPAKPLAQAITDLSARTSLQVLYTDPAPLQRMAPALKGTFTADQALRQLLSGSGLAHRFTGPNAVTVEKTAADGAMTLDPVTVEGAAPVQAAESAYGPVQGYVAKRTSTATKSDAEILTTPQSVSVVGAEEMETRNVQTLEDAVKYVPGVHLSYGATGDARSSWYAVRGFSGSATYYQDGLKNTGSWLRPDMYLVERTEVLRGPSSVMYGQTIPGGMFNLVTKKPQDKQAAEVAVELGNADWKRAEGDVTGPMDKDGRWLYRVVAAVQESDGLNGLDHDRNDVKLFAPSLTWKPRDGTAITVGIVRQENESRGWAPTMRTSTAQGTTSRSTYLGEPDYDRYREEQTQFNLSASHRINDALTADLNTRYVRVDRDYRQIWPDAVQSDGATLSRTNYYTEEKTGLYALDARLTGKVSVLSTDHTLLGGFDYFYYDLDKDYGVTVGSGINLFNPTYGNVSNIALTGSYYADSRSPGLYAQDQISIGDKWFVMVGGRQDFSGVAASDGYQDTFTGRLGLAYKTDFGLVPYASYGESFEPQSGTGWGGTKFEPTTGRQYEVGLKYEPPGTNAIATIALFDLRKRNVLTTDPDTSHSCGGGQCQIQTGEVTSRGLELGLTMGLAEGLNAVASYTYNPVSVTKDSDPGVVGRQLYDTPIHLASVWLDYGLKDGPLAGLGFGGGLRFVGKTTNYAGDMSTSPYVQDEYMARYDVNDWRLSLNVKNLFDREIEYMCDRQTYAETCYLQEPLTVTARVARKF
jgi:TonB-dependent siderophore receptor